MPTTYVHDAFGRKVYHRLPENMQEMIHRHVQLYRIGLHGPDILFYYGLSKNSVNQTGVRMHGEIAAPFFARGMELVRRTQDEALLVYLLGFACHYMLDSTCHPYIYGIADRVSHNLIEKEMDRRLMEKDGLDPLTYFPARGIIPSEENAAVVAKMFPDITPKQIQQALSGLRRWTSLMIYGQGQRRKVIETAMNLVGLNRYMDFFMSEKADETMLPDLEELDRLFEQALEETPEILTDLFNCALYPETSVIPDRFNRNYKEKP